MVLSNLIEISRLLNVIELSDVFVILSILSDPLLCPKQIT